MSGSAGHGRWGNRFDHGVSAVTGALGFAPRLGSASAARHQRFAVPEGGRIGGVGAARQVELNETFHRLLYEGSGNVLLARAIHDLVRFFHAYRTAYNPRARLIIAGAYSGFERYLTLVHHLIASLGVQDVHILGQVSNEVLTALYDVADLFLGASEHEGFCVPLIEAFYKRIPVVAYASTAVPATLHGMHQRPGTDDDVKRPME